MLLVLFVLLFIVALFNDDVAAIMQKYVFRRGRQTQNNANYYDDRLYGRQDDYRQQQRNPRPNNYNQGSGYGQGYGNQGYDSRGYSNQGGYSQGQNQGQRQRPQNRQAPAYYNADGTPRRQQPQNQQPPQDYYQANARRARQQQNQANQAGYTADATRAYTIPGRGNNAR